MESCMTAETFRVFSSTRSKLKLCVICVTLSLLGYLLYFQFGFRAAASTATLELRQANFDEQYLSRGLLHKKNDVDTTGEELDGGKSKVQEDEVVPDDDVAPDDKVVPIRLKGPLTKKFPNAIIIGVKKGGTRALLEYMRLHPNIVAAGPEIHFFDRYIDRGMDWYREKMPKSAKSQLTLEKTPAYFITKEAPDLIYSMSKSIKLFLIVRDPVTRLISDYAQSLEKDRTIPPLKNLIFKNLSEPVVDEEKPLVYIGLYARHLANWIRYFPLRQLLIINGDSLIKNPVDELTRVQKFLGLKLLVTEKNFEYQPDKGFFCSRKAEEKYSILHCLGKNKGRTHPNVEPWVIMKLKEYYKPYNKMFYEMVGQDFGWD
ncbi:unnamed protein product [Ophioblennius macclurei]